MTTTKRVTRAAQLPLPEGWEWTDYRIPRLENPHTGAKMEFVEVRQPSCETKRVGHAFIIGKVPSEVRRIFDRRNLDIGPHAPRPA